MFGRNQVAIVMAEFLGTGALALVVLSVQHSTIGLPYFVALLAGLALATMMVALGRTGGGVHLNPAITIGMWTTRQIKTVPALVYIAAQLLGAWAAYYLYVYMTKAVLQDVGGHYDSRVLVAEAVGAFVFSLGWAAAVFNRFLQAKAAATIGAAFALAVVVASSASLGIVNPALALSDRAFAVAGSMGWGTYALGPVLGAVIGFNLYALLFAPESSLLKLGSLAAEKVGSSASVSAATTKESVVPKSSTVKAKSRSSRTRKK